MQFACESNQKKRRHIDWIQVSILHGRQRTAFDCFCNYMRRLTVPRAWNKTELRLLKSVTSKFHFQHKVFLLIGSNQICTSVSVKICSSVLFCVQIQWTHVSEFFDGRSPQECQDKYKKMTSHSLRLGRWSPDEDVLLLKVSFSQLNNLHHLREILDLYVLRWLLPFRDSSFG